MRTRRSESSPSASIPPDEDRNLATALSEPDASFLTGEADPGFAPMGEFCGVVTVGSRGQMVIPAAVREGFRIEKGDKLIVTGDPFGIGIILCKVESVGNLLNEMERIRRAIAERGIPSSSPPRPREE